MFSDCTFTECGVSMALAAVAAYVAYMFLFKKTPGPNPFAKDHRRTRAELVTEKEKRDKVLKTGYLKSRIPDNLDAIIVGSGMGGMTCGTLLAKAGKKVLLLEQHDQIGGCCHTYHDKGYEFDVGIHYIGEMRNHSATKFLFDQITDGQIIWSDLENHYDTVVFGDLKNPKKIPIASGREEFRTTLKKHFPAEKDHKAIDEYIKLLSIVRKNTLGFIMMKTLPLWLARFLGRTGLVNLLTDFFKYTKSLTEVLDSISDNEELKATLAYCFGDYGTLPKDAPFTMHAVLVNHFLYGVSYPVGGPSEFGFHMIPTIEKAGGKALVRATVDEIVMDGSGRAIGVRMKKDGNVIRAPMVISAAGIYNTYEKLLPSVKSPHALSTVQHGWGAMSLYIGLKCTPQELGLKPQNYWIFPTPNLNEDSDRYLNLPADEAGKEDIPLLFLSFPSAKDPSWDAKFPGKMTVSVITLAKYEWFEQWVDERVGHRGQDYEAVKNRIGKKMWEQVCRMYPAMKDKLEYFDVASAITNNHYIAASRGEIYGVDHNKERFYPQNAPECRPETNIPGLYLTGQDVFTCGFAGAMFSGLLTASTVLNRNLFNDLMELKAKSKKTV
eukprot:GFYU01000146.1.p1 GENE.GFYU01000146.1~~GFYU01000146.1.p1  ORF type:complete len:608 (-),score=259.18 GFYU01000146.1:63-1886(-)